MAKWTRKSIQAEELDHLNRNYVPMEATIAATGFSQKKLLTWATEHGIEHRKYDRRWYFDKADLIQAVEEQTLRSHTGTGQKDRT